MTLTAQPVDQNPIGYFRIFATPPNGTRREITVFRGAPIMLTSCSTTDPFTDTTASMDCPQITVFDAPGRGDLDWLVEDSDIDIVWFNYGSYDFEWSWEGYITSYDFDFSPSSSSFRIELQGALFALDHYLAQPIYPSRPIPYEILIKRAFDPSTHPARLAPIKITFPDNWAKTVPEFTEPNYLSALKPVGVVSGQKWTGLTSRSTGSWEPLLSGHVQGLLTTMFDEGGSQWTIRNRGKRRPELYLRNPASYADDDVLNIVVGAPGVSISASKDYSQRANVIYGQGKDEAGITYSGQAISPDGKNTYFQPFAWSPSVYPREGNPSLRKGAMPKETIIRFTDGLDQTGAQKVAAGQLQRFSDPGITGTITLSSDPRKGNGAPFPRMLIKAGANMRLRGLQGITEGLLVHITQATVNFSDLTVTLTFDSKYRDVLTVDEVRARTRDALSPLRSLQIGKFSNTIQDLFFPWSYSEGSGIVPSGGSASAKEFFLEKLPANAQFPYEDFTRQYPPKDYPNYYIKIGPTDTANATNNWSAAPRNGAKSLALPIRMGQSGSIRLSQFAAYDKNGNVMPVRFHVSIYDTNGVGPADMPKFPVNPDDIQWLHPLGVSVTYASHQSNPFIKDGWETVMPDGTQTDPYTQTAANANLKVGWGNYYEPAGYSPGRASRGAERSGLLVDDTQWTWDNSSLFQPTTGRPDTEEAGSLFIMFYCDEQGDQPVYFMGRLFRVEPGTQ